MRLYFTLVACFLFVFTVRADRRRADRHSRFLNRVEQSANDTSDGIEYSTNWAGAMWSKAKDSGTFTSITGTFTVPVPSGKKYSATSAWVGIDGDTCKGGLLQAGVDITVTDKGPSYDAWYEWYPDWTYDFPNLSISAEDTIRVTVIAYSPTSGSAEIENLSNGQHGFVELDSPHALCGESAEWIVEDFSEGVNHTRVPFADFGTVTFSDAVAGGEEIFTPEGATIIDIKQKGKVLTSVSVDGSCVTIEYV